jgi:uncharacterized spore protein YtfJ
MDQNPNLSQNVDTLFSNLGSFTQNEGVLGKPVTHGEITFIPVVSVTLGYGSGDKASKNNHGASSQGGTNPAMGMGMGNMSGGAIGLGARLCTEAVIVIDKDNVSAIPIKAGANANQLMDKIPQILSGMNQNKQQGQQQEQQQNQAQSQQQQ